MYILYSALLALGLLLTLPYWLLQMVRYGKYRAGLSERMGRVPGRILKHPALPCIWVHAVSVGEVISVAGVIGELQKRLPGYRVVVSTTTHTGQKIARSRFGDDSVFFFPLDFKFAIQPYLRALHPKLVVIAETEFWPNFLRLVHGSGARIAIVNARVSDRSFPGYLRWSKLLKRVLSTVDVFSAQGQEDASRLAAIGAPRDRVQVGGNLKFDAEPSSPLPVVESLRAMLHKTGAGPVLVCGSTVAEEERLLANAFKNVFVSFPKAVIVLAPRHPERFSEVAELLQELQFRFWLRSEWDGLSSLSGGVVLLDSVGELSSVYGIADIAFVGGSLVPRGGHNVIEPAQHSAAIIVGNHTENFKEIIGLFRATNAIRVVGPAEFPIVLMELMGNPVERAKLGRRAHETWTSQRGAAQRTVELLVGLLRAPHSSE